VLMKRMMHPVRIVRTGVLILAICIGAFGGAPVFAFGGSGTGTSLDPYEITSCAQLDSINLDLTAHYALANDIDCSDAASLNSGAGWAPIGASGSGFEGMLDGQGHKIKNLDLSGFADNANITGMFNQIVNNGVVKNLSVINSKVNGGHDVGMVAGTLNGNASLDNIYVQATVTCHTDNCGGLVGALEDSTLINNSGADVAVTSTDQSVGGLVGYISNTGVVQKSYANGYLSGTHYIGGLVGAVLTGGGIATVTNSYSSATAIGDDSVGGLVGLGINVDVTKSYAAGSVSGDDNVGGLVGQLYGSMADTFSAEEIINTTGSGTVGPVTGHVISATVGNRYFDTNSTGFASSPDGSSPITDSNYFKNNSTNPPFDQWDFSTLWRTNYANYPSFAPKVDPYMLCEAPSSSNTSITGNCEVAPLGWGTPVWQARWRVHGTSTWQVIALGDIHEASATVAGLKPGTWYDLSFRYTNDFGTGPWGTVEILTTGTAATGTPGKGTVTPSTLLQNLIATATGAANDDSSVPVDKETSLTTPTDSTDKDTTSDQTTPKSKDQKASEKEDGPNLGVTGFIVVFTLLIIWLISRFIRRKNKS
jgi:hypothetical protein